MKKLIIFTIITIALFSSCINRQILLNQEEYQIRAFIEKLGVDFDTTPSGVLYRIDSLADSSNIRYFEPDEDIMMIYTGTNLDNNQVFVQNDTVIFKLNDPLILDGWREILSVTPKTAYGQAIFPFYTAFDKKRIFNIPPYSTLYFVFYVDTVPQPNLKQKMQK